MSDITDLVTALGGDSKVPAIYDTRYSVTQGAGVVTAWDDARGGGFGPQLVGTGTTKPAWDSTNLLITFDGVQNYLVSAIAAEFDPVSGKSYIYIGTLPAGNFPLAIADVGVTKFITLCTQSSTIKTSNSSLTSIFSPVAVGAVRRLALLSYAPANFYPAGTGAITNPQEIMAVQSRAGRMSQSATGGYLADAVTAATASNWQLWVGNYASQFTANSVRAIVVLDHPVTESEWRIIGAWSATYHQHVVEQAVSRLIYFDGNSLTIGQGSSAGNDYPSQVMASAGYTTNLDYVNGGVSSRTGTQMVFELPYRIPALFNGTYGRKVYVCWEIGNDIHNGVSAATAVANVQALCQAAKAAGATACVALTANARSDIAGAAETARLAANVSLRALPAGIDAVADVASIVNLQTTSNLTYFQADGIHLTDAGYGEVALNSTYGVAVTALPYLVDSIAIDDDGLRPTPISLDTLVSVW